MVNELLIQMQSFDQPPLRTRLRAKMIGWVNAYLPTDRQLTAIKSEYHNILLIAATNRGDSLDAALVRPGRFDRRLYFDVPTKQGRVDLIDWFLDRKSHHQQLDDPQTRERIAYETFGYTPVMIEHLFDEGMLVALREGRRQMNFDDVMEAKLNEEIGLKQPVVYTEQDREAVATHEAGHATVAYFVGQNRRLEVLSIIKRRGSLGMLAHGDSEERFTRTRSEIESGIAIALGGLVAEELCIGDAGTGPGGRPRARHQPRRGHGRVVRHGGLADLLRRRDAGPDRRREPGGQGPRRQRGPPARGRHPRGAAREGHRRAGGQPRCARRVA